MELVVSLVSQKYICICNKFISCTVNVRRVEKKAFNELVFIICAGLSRVLKINALSL
jgi:hypothetical protein